MLLFRVEKGGGGGGSPATAENSNSQNSNDNNSNNNNEVAEGAAAVIGEDPEGFAASTSASMMPMAASEQLLTWEKLSPAEFQQLQDFAACKYKSNIAR